jgi:hypothetical protein
MYTASANTTSNPEITLEVGGDLRLTGHDLNQIMAEGDDNINLATEAQGSQASLSCSGSCTVRVPRHARLQFAHIGGDARLKDLEAELSLKNVGGDLVLRRVAGVKFERVGGDLSAKQVTGSLLFGEVAGDISARDVEGGVAGTAGGDIYLRNVEAEASAIAGGDVVLNLEFTPNHAYDFSAGGDIICRLPPDASATITTKCTGDLSVDAPGARVEKRNGQKVVILGAGEATVSLQAGSDITISDVTVASSGVADSGDDFGERIAAEIEAKVSARLAEVERELNLQFGNLNISLSGLGGVDAERIAAKVRRAAESARRRNESAQRKADALNRKAEALQRKAEQINERTGRRKSWGFTFAMPPMPPRPPTPSRPPAPPGAEPVSEDERLSILRMLEQGKISAADAEKLLAALEGKAS